MLLNRTQVIYIICTRQKVKKEIAFQPKKIMQGEFLGNYNSLKA